MATPIWEWPATLSSPVAVPGSLDGSATSHVLEFSVRCWERCGGGPFASIGVTLLMIVLTPLFCLAVLVDLVRACVSVGTS